MNARAHMLLSLIHQTCTGVHNMNNPTEVMNLFHRMPISDQLMAIAALGHTVVDDNERPEWALIDGEWVNFDELEDVFFNTYMRSWLMARDQAVDAAEKKRKADFARQDNIACALSAVMLLVLVVIPFIVFGEV